MFPDVWALVALLVALVMTGVLAVLQVRGKAVWLWAWFVPGVLVLVYGLIALLLKLTEFGNYLGIGYVDDVATIHWLRKEFPWAAGVSGLMSAVVLKTGEVKELYVEQIQYGRFRKSVIESLHGSRQC